MFRTHKFITYPGGDPPCSRWQSDWSRHQCHHSTNSHWSLSSAGILPSSYWATGLCYMSPRQQCGRNTRAPDLTMPDTWPDLPDVAWPPNFFRPKMHLELPGMDRGSDLTPLVTLSEVQILQQECHLLAITVK